MKKVLFVLLFGILISIAPKPAWAVVLETEYGYKITGVVGAIAVDPTKTNLWVSDMFFTPVNAATDTATFTTAQVSGSTQNTVLIMDRYLPHIHWPNEGKQFMNLEVTLTAVTDVVTIHIKK